MSFKNAFATKLDPDSMPLSSAQARRLSGLTQIDSSYFTGRTVAEIGDKCRWQIDPHLLLFKRVSGRAVAEDPFTEDVEPVTFAVVSLEYEGVTVADTVTDGSGNFRLWVPRFEIEWILRLQGVKVPVSEIRGLSFRIAQEMEGCGSQAIYPMALWDAPKGPGDIPGVTLQTSRSGVARASFARDAGLRSNVQPERRARPRSGRVAV